MSQASEDKMQHNSAPQEERFIVFKVDENNYAIPLLKVKEVTALLEIVPVPKTAKAVSGIINLRGQIVTVYDLRICLQRPQAGKLEHGSIIVLDLEPYSLGILVDSVEEVFTDKSGGQKANHPECASIHDEFIGRIIERGNGLLFVLQIEKVLGISSKNAHAA